MQQAVAKEEPGSSCIPLSMYIHTLIAVRSTYFSTHFILNRNGQFYSLRIFSQYKTGCFPCKIKTSFQTSGQGDAL